MQINYFSPILKFEPESAILVSRPFLFCKNFSKWQSFNVSKISSVLCLPRGSMFSLIVPSNNWGSYKIIVILYLKSNKFISEISTSSIKIFPLKTSSTLNRLRVIVDFPAPVLPTTPIFSWESILISNPFNTVSKFYLYFTSTP